MTSLSLKDFILASAQSIRKKPNSKKSFLYLSQSTLGLLSCVCSSKGCQSRYNVVKHPPIIHWARDLTANQNPHILSPSNEKPTFLEFFTIPEPTWFQRTCLLWIYCYFAIFSLLHRPDFHLQLMSLLRSKKRRLEHMWWQGPCVIACSSWSISFHFFIGPTTASHLPCLKPQYLPFPLHQLLHRVTSHPTWSPTWARTGLLTPWDCVKRRNLRKRKLLALHLHQERYDLLIS